MAKVEIEQKLEDRCVAKISAAGGMALKLSIPGVRGFPDRTMLMPGGKVSFYEFKRIKGGVISKAQQRWRVLLFGLGFNVHFVSTDAEFDAAFEREMSR